jgi:excinuclease ABC subunit C
MDLRDKAAQLPLSPGVYLYKDAAGPVIYVGKAKSLRLRVRSYFNEDRLADTKTGTLIAEAADIDYILVDNEKEALALENNLIKQYKPRFNILLRDDKTYPYIKLTSEKYPRVYVTRRLRKDGSTYYGPLLSRQPGAPPGALHPSPLSGAVVQGGPDPLPSQALSAISHPSLPGTLRGRSHH